MVIRGELDVAIAEEYDHAPRPRLPQLHREYLKPDQLVLALPRRHPAAEREGPIALSALRDARWAAPRAPSAFADMVARLCRSVGGFEPDVRHRAYDLYLLIELVAVRGAVALLPALGHPERDPRIAVRPIADGEYTRALFVATRESDRARPSTAAVVRALREAPP
jgi:DNA-binding transcriptional LysR family regulator